MDNAKDVHSGPLGPRYEGHVVTNESIIVPELTLQTKFINAWYGELGDSFIVTLRILTLSPDPTKYLDYVRMTGYRELFVANWSVRPTRTCQHSVREIDTLKLPAGCVAKDFIRDNEFHHLPEPRVVVAITPNIPAARWQTLAAIACERQDANYDTLYNK